MPLLVLDDGPFASGRARFFDSPPDLPNRASIYVRIVIDGMEEPTLALVDTGAEYSVIAREVAQSIGLNDIEGQNITLVNRFGSTPGKLVKANVTVLADEGSDLAVYATVFVPNNDAPWPIGRNFIGYTGFLEAIRLGLDPQTNDLYFGGY